MTTKPFVDHHAYLFQDAIFDRDVVARTRWLNDAIDTNTEFRRRLWRNPYTPAAIIVGTHMHRHALAVPALRWDGFWPELTCVGLESMLWQLSDVETTLLGMAWHINPENKRLNDDDPDSMELFWISQLTAVAVWITGSGGDAGFFGNTRS